MKTLLLISILALLGGNPAALLRDRCQQKTLESLKDVGGDDCSFYSMDYKADYRLQDFIDADYNSQGALRAGVMQRLLKAPEAAPASAMNPACSAFQAVTPDGDVIYARNFDYRFKDGATVMVRTAPRKGYKSISMVSMSFLGMDGAQLKDGKTDLSVLVAAPLMQMDGMNEKGLAVSVLCVMYDACAQQYDTTKHTVMTSVMMRMLLDRAAGVDEAVDMLENYNFFADGLQKERKKGDFSNYHFLLSDASGRSVVLEYVLRDGPGTDSPWVLKVLEEKSVTNHFLTPGWECTSKGCERLDKIRATLSEKGGVLTEEEAMALLDDVHQVADKKGPGKTQWSVVYNLTRRTAKVCINHDYSKTYEFAIRHPRRFF